VPSLIVLNARGASLQGQTLTLVGVTPNSIVFADRPVRSAGRVLTAHLLEEWATGSDSFAKDPPNATVSVFTKDGSGVRDAVVVLKTPKLDGERPAVSTWAGEQRTLARFELRAAGFFTGGNGDNGDELKDFVGT
jgi:hypothetical protein